jgi:hypothetical protein
MPDYVTTHFIKFFSEERYADEFARGRLYLNRLSYFSKLENNLDDGRPDSHEAIAMWLQPNDLSIELNIAGIGRVSLTKADLAGPVSMSFDYHDHLHVLCLYALGTPGTITSDGEIDIGTMSEEALRGQLSIDERCITLGPFAVVTAVSPFLGQLRNALQSRGLPGKGRFVEYYDEETFHGKISPVDIPFKKQKRFGYQKEYRLCVNSNTKGDEPLILDIGDIRGISAKFQSSRLNDLFQNNLRYKAGVADTTGNSIRSQLTLGSDDGR